LHDGIKSSSSSLIKYGSQRPSIDPLTLLQGRCWPDPSLVQLSVCKCPDGGHTDSLFRSPSIVSRRFEATSQLDNKASKVTAPNTDPHTPDPKSRAAALIDSLPGNSILSKTGFLTVGTAALATAVSKELYIFNDESVILICSSLLLYLVVQLGAPGYNAWVNQIAQQHTNLLTSARQDHKQAIQERIDSVGQMRNVVEITKNLFEVSKDTAKVEAEVFELQQKVDFANEAKTVVDSWVRYEASQRQREQKQMADTITAKIRDEIKNPRLQQQLLQQSVADVESLSLHIITNI
jgi:F-type H+-transporting ATPase subunit b